MTTEEAAVVARQRQERMMYVVGGAALMGAVGACFWALNWMNQQGQRAALHARRRQWQEPASGEDFLPEDLNE